MIFSSESINLMSDQELFLKMQSINAILFFTQECTAVKRLKERSIRKKCLLLTVCSKSNLEKKLTNDKN